MPALIVIFLLAMTPLGELRAAIPFGLITYDIPWPAVLAVAIAGNLAPVPFVLLGLYRVGTRLEEMNNPIGSLLRWRTSKLRNRWIPNGRYGFMAILLLVAIPLPATGAWTGTLAVWSLQVPLRQGLPAIALGVVLAGLVVTALSLASVEVIQLAK